MAESKATPIYISCSNLSHAWAQAFNALLEPGVDQLTPLIVNISGFATTSPPEDPLIRTALDHELSSNKRLCEIQTTSNTIFPLNLWQSYKSAGRDVFFERYLKVTLPRLKRADRRNSRGTYFERMLRYGVEEINQLAFILDSWDQGHRRRSALQLAIFDPSMDHTANPYLAFPCLDHIAFAPEHGGGLSLTAFYANHYLFARGYGNYLGLCNLGCFLAHELGLRFTQLTCVSGKAELNCISKRKGRDLYQEFGLSATLEQTE